MRLRIRQPDIMDVLIRQAILKAEVHQTDQVNLMQTVIPFPLTTTTLLGDQRGCLIYAPVPEIHLLHLLHLYDKTLAAVTRA